MLDFEKGQGEEERKKQERDEERDGLWQKKRCEIDKKII